MDAYLMLRKVETGVRPDILPVGRRECTPVEITSSVAEAGKVLLNHVTVEGEAHGFNHVVVHPFYPTAFNFCNKFTFSLKAMCDKGWHWHKPKVACISAKDVAFFMAAAQAAPCPLTEAVAMPVRS